LYFLFGKERDTDENPGWSDFGGGSEKGEALLDTAIREGGEELTGFLGNEKDIQKLLSKHGTYTIDYTSVNHSVYRVHVFPMEYNPYLTHYYNNNERFLQKKLDPKIIEDMKIFEKQEIKWFSVKDILKQKKEFRTFYQNVVELLIQHKKEIDLFIRKSQKKIKNKTRKTRK
jgi:8-oxo-dGTP pyrophosphatase MutT (NUDIX family)